MKIKIRSEEDNITEEVKKHIEKKIAKLDKYLRKPEELEARVLIKTRDNQEVAEVTIPMDNKTILRAKERGSNVYAAVNQAVEVLERQIRRNKTKIESRKKKDINIDED